MKVGDFKIFANLAQLEQFSEQEFTPSLGQFRLETVSNCGAKVFMKVTKIR